MDIKDIVNKDRVNLQNCESEPIHIPGSIQPHGFLLAVKESTGIIEFCSENIGTFTGVEPAAVLGKTVKEVFGTGEAAALQKYLVETAAETSHPFLLHARNTPYNTTIHRTGELLLLEGEPLPDGALSIPDLYRQTEKFISHMESAGDLLDLCGSIAKETKNVTGYDRVMIYRFDENYNGEVIAESKNDDLGSFAGQKYPHTDIPAQARELYIRNPMRLIADVSYRPVPLLTLANSEKNNSSLDLSLSVLRSVSPIHVEYLKNMGVGATLTISLLCNKKLWGLIACHHYSAKVLPYFTRLSALLQGNFLTSQIAVREAAEELAVTQRSENVLKELFAMLGKSTDFIRDHFDSPLIRELANASGVIIYYDGKIYSNGKVPSDKDARLLINLLIDNYRLSGFHTSALSEIFPETAGFAEQASGIIYHSFSNVNEDCIIWLREEIVETIKWAGKPHKDSKEDAPARLTPRKSFELWIEEVRNKSRAWRRPELHAAESFAYSLDKYSGLFFSRMQEERYRTLSEELKEANKELANINWISTHDLKEPIRKIQIFASMVLDRNEDLSESTRQSVSRMRTAASRMQSLIEDILSYSRTGNHEGIFTETDLGTIMSETLADLRDDIEERGIVIELAKLPVLNIIPFQVRQLFVNVLGNAVKFADSDRAPVIQITADRVQGSELPQPTANPDGRYAHIAVSDNGIGFEKKYAEKIFEVFQRLHSSKEYSGTGIGLAICRKIMENHRGFITAVSAPGEGTTMNMFFPLF